MILITSGVTCLTKMLKSKWIEMIVSAFSQMSVQLPSVDKNISLVDGNNTFFEENINLGDETLSYKSFSAASKRLEDICCFFPDHYLEISQPDFMNKDSSSERNIIFIESSCYMEDGLFSLDARQACAVESAALHNPEYQIHVLFLGPRGDSNNILHKYLKRVYKVKFHQVDLMAYVDKTPVMDLVKNKLRQSNHAMTHLSDILRLLTLQKYGGVYLDLDVVVVKPLRDLPPCFVGAEDLEVLGNAVMAFNNSAFGRAFVDLLIRELVQTFSSTSWASNGPGVITRVIKRLCPQDDFWPAYCTGVRVLESQYLYPMPLVKWRWYMEEPASLPAAGRRYVANLRKDPRVHVHHMWNSRSPRLRLHPLSLYSSLATDNCPRVYRLTLQDF